MLLDRITHLLRQSWLLPVGRVPHVGPSQEPLCAGYRLRRTITEILCSYLFHRQCLSTVAVAEFARIRAFGKSPKSGDFGYGPRTIRGALPFSRGRRYAG